MANPIFGLSIDGGLDTEMGPTAGFPLKGDGATVSVPWLLSANNVVYARDGWPKKMPGATRVNATTTGATDAVMGIYDYWRSTTSGAPVQRRVISSGTSIYSESGTGTLTEIKASIEATKVHAFEVFDDVLIIATTGTTDVPWTWNQSAFANLGGTPPNFSFHVEHKDRMWAAGVDALKSRLYYSVSGSAADWVGAGSGSVDVSPDDGDVITGLASHKGELIIFKGPNRGRILRLTGSSPSDFALVPFIRGVGCVAHNSIVPVNDDLIFWDDLGIHSLNATAAFGDYAAAYLSAPIRSFFQSLSHDDFGFLSGVNFQPAGYAMWTTARSTNGHDVIVVYDYSFTPPRFALWPAYQAVCLAMVRDTNRVPTPWCGTYTGHVLRMNQTARNIGGVAFGYDVKMPYLSFGDPFLDKTCMKGRVGYAPKGTEVFSVSWRRDGSTEQRVDITQTSEVDTLAPSDSEFILDESVLGGGTYQQAFFDMSGQFKEIQLQLSQVASLDHNVEPHSMALEVEASGIGTTRSLG